MTDPCINVWYIYLHLPLKPQPNVGKCTSPIGSYGVVIIFTSLILEDWTQTHRELTKWTSNQSINSCFSFPPFCTCGKLLKIHIIPCLEVSREHRPLGWCWGDQANTKRPRVKLPTPSESSKNFRTNVRQLHVNCQKLAEVTLFLWQRLTNSQIVKWNLQISYACQISPMVPAFPKKNEK